MASLAAMAVDESTLLARFQQVRAYTEELCKPLATEDYVVQPMPDASPTKWHLAHVTWFFEQFVVSGASDNYRPFNELYWYLFNSYYIRAGQRWHRPSRGLLSRPTVEEIFAYRRHVDSLMHSVIEGCLAGQHPRLLPVVEIGLNHEQQHQELLLTDIKNVFSINPLNVVYGGQPAVPPQSVPALEWIGFNGGLAEFGYGGAGFCYDNELPRHKQHIEPFELASRLVTNGEWQEFMADGGYETPELWLSDGAAWLEQSGTTAPGYWERRGGEWWHYTLAGWRQVAENEPVCHISLYEADAYANWRGARLPTEYEWELAARAENTAGNFADSGRFHPSPPVGDGKGLSQLYGDAWEWTRSQYAPYPGFEPLSGALGEYNGKFMCDQFVLRGGSCATSPGHIRPTYRNFFAAPSRWQFTGLRLARDAS